MAIYRVLFFKYNKFVKTIGDSNFVFALTILGYGIIVTFSAFIASHDQGILYKMCTHYSVEELIIMNVSINLF